MSGIAPVATPAKGPGPLLQVSHLHTHFKTDVGTVKAVEDVSFSLDAGETLAVVGESGSGKSVTSLSIMGLIADPPGRIVGGEILFRTRAGPVVDLARLPARALRKLRGRDLAMIFQEPMTSLNPVFTVGEQIAEAAVLHLGMHRSAAARRALEMLELVEIPAAKQRFGHYPHQLSGGMRQRVMIAIALACNPLLLIADEPTTALDVTIQAQILALLDKLRREIGMAVLFVTHNLAVVAEFADRVVVMYAGKVVEEGDVRSVFRAPKHPYTQGLLACLPRRALAALAPGGTRRLNAIPGQVAGPHDPLPGCAFAPRCALALAECAAAMPPLADIAARSTLALPALGRAVSEPMLRVRGLKKYFGQRDHPVRAVDDVSFEIAPGEVLGMVGESGSGKSTIGRSLLKLIEPSAGEIRFEGDDLAPLSTRAMRPYRRRLQIIFQDPYASLNPRRRVGDTLGEALATHGLHPGPARAPRIAELLSLVGLAPEHARRYPHEFSGGQRQRIGIARALAVEPRFIVADEPVSALDVSIQAQVINLLSDLRERFGLTMLFISHDLDVVEYLCDRIVVLYLGKIMEVGPARELVRTPQHPYTQALLDASPRPDPEARRERRLLQGDIPSPIDPPSGCVFRTRCPYAQEACAALVPPLREVAPGRFKACLRDDIS